jgi:hypothetical protein
MLRFEFAALYHYVDHGSPFFGANLVITTARIVKSSFRGVERLPKGDVDCTGPFYRLGGASAVGLPQVGTKHPASGAKYGPDRSRSQFASFLRQLRQRHSSAKWMYAIRLLDLLNWKARGRWKYRRC